MTGHFTRMARTLLGSEVLDATHDIRCRQRAAQGGRSPAVRIGSERPKTLSANPIQGHHSARPDDRVASCAIAFLTIAFLWAARGGSRI